ncbi:MAG: FGGY family carbohydrate kinase [Clostridia bacterium]|nr:FGGY family carbohydrate kinase [Clostridia bacterium]
MKIIAYDLGTGGVKASLFDQRMVSVAKSFTEYPTYYPSPDRHEQRPADWWNGVIKSTEALLRASGADPSEIGCLSLSGHSLVAVPISARNEALAERVPIWSDRRAGEQAACFFTRINAENWYMTTGNGFPAPCYSLFKLMWLKENQPDVYRKTKYVLGSKDFINLLLTGEGVMDPSYASGTGAFRLREGTISPDYLEAAELPPDLFPPIVPSHHIVGRLTPQAASALGLHQNVAVACGGVDNACMALGAVGAEDGGIYCSLGSSSWIPLNSRSPVLDWEKKPYVFAHIQEGMFTSAFSIFSGGSSFKWSGQALLGQDMTDPDAYDRMAGMAQSAKIGANGVFFNPSLAGGTSQDKSPHIRGAFVGLHLGVSQNDLIRAVMEGICLNLKSSLSYLRQKTRVSDSILFCGGGSKSPFWMQMFADVFDMTILKTNIDQDAASFGAAGIAFVAMKIWEDYSRIPGLHKTENRTAPIPENVTQYSRIFPRFVHANEMMSELGDYIYHDEKR